MSKTGQPSCLTATSPPYHHMSPPQLLTLLLLCHTTHYPPLNHCQDHLFAAFGSDEDEVVFVSYAGGCVLLTGLCVVTGELGAAISFINESLGGATGVAAVSLVCFAACGYLGVM